MVCCGFFVVLMSEVAVEKQKATTETLEEKKVMGYRYVNDI